MYESHFGFKASPFQLNPDPDFYFDSSGHNKALAHLRYGVEQGEGFIVITGEVGAGKTTLVRALLQQLDLQKLVAAQISNTQLDADNLLQTILTAFGVSASGLSKASMITGLEAFLTSVAASGRRALLVIDEAQNLSPQALEELRMLSNFQLGKHSLLQSFLVGQPELRQNLQLPSMVQLQQRILASYHLGPLDAAETAAYVLHRLRHVGWSGQRPTITDDAFSQLHQRSGGIPRRINLLCSRLLLAAYLSNSSSISARLVDEIADDMELEVKPAVASTTPAPRKMAELQAHGLTQVSAQAPKPSLGTPTVVGKNAAAARKYKLAPGAVLAVAGDALAWGQLQLLCRSWTQTPGIAQPMVMVHPGASRLDIPAAWREHDLGQAPAPCVYLECPSGPEGRRAAALSVRFAELVAEVKPEALIVAGSGFDLVQLTLIARQLNVPFIRLGAGDGSRGSRDERVLTAELLNISADLLCVPSINEHQRLLAQGIASWRVARVAPMTSALLRAAAPGLPSLEESWARLKLPTGLLGDPRGYALVTGQVVAGDLSAQDLVQWLMVVRHAQPELPLVWLAGPETADALSRPELQNELRESGVAVAPVDDTDIKWAVLSKARCLISGPGRELMEEAQTLGIPAVVVHLRGDRRLEWAGAGVVQVGPSQTQYLSAVRAALRSPHDVRDPSELSDLGVSDLIAHIRHWLKDREALPFRLHDRTAAA
jgi:general secretion pathway protein A